MPESELLAIAAHLHVLLRRSCGRVTDTEWLAANAEYAAEIIRFAREQEGARSTPELVEWTHRFEAAWNAALAGPAERSPLMQRAGELMRQRAENRKYVGTLRWGLAGSGRRIRPVERAPSAAARARRHRR